MNNKKEEFLANEKVSTLLFKLSVPATIGMLVYVLYYLIDTIFVGRGVGTEAIGGLTIAFPFLMLIMAVAKMLGVGTSSLISRNLGSNNKERAYTATGNNITLALGFGIIIAIVGLLLLDSILMLFGATEVLMEYAKDYLFIILLGSPFISLSLASNSTIQAEGKAKISMMNMVISTVINIVLDPILIFGFNMGIKGAALATVIAQIVWFTLVIKFYFSKKSTMYLKLEHFIPEPSVIKEIITLGLPSFIRQAGVSVVMVIINNSLAYYGGTIYISAIGIVLRILRVTMVPLAGIAQGFKPIVGYNFGAKKFIRVKNALKYSLLSSFVIGFIGFLILFIYPNYIFMMFGSDKELINVGKSLMKIVVLVLPIVGIHYIATEYFLAIGKALPAYLIGLSRQIFLLIPLILIFPLFLGVKGVFIAFPVADLLATSIAIYFLIKEAKKLKLKAKDS
ncbi:MAG: MATE family efflux transporter [Firmicutes bacterium]|nr:MATE family efflux transporter [Bacillota bacterium]